MNKKIATFMNQSNDSFKKDTYKPVAITGENFWL